MKNYNLSSTFTVLPNNTNNKNHQRQNKEKFNVLNKKNINTSNEEKNNHHINNQKQNYKLINKHKQYNSALHINNINHNRNIDNNIDTNVSYQNNRPTKELINSISLNNFEDLDEKLDIKLPYNNDRTKITNSLANTITTNNYNYKGNFRSNLYINNNEKEKLNTISLSNAMNENNKKNESYNDKLFNTFSKIGNLFQLFQNGIVNEKNSTNNIKNKFIQNNKNENRNITIGRNLGKENKKLKDLEEILKKENPLNNSNLINRNNYYINKNRNLFKNYYNKNYNATFENEHANKQNNLYCAKGPSGNYIRNFQNENRDILNFSNNNKQKFSVTKKDLKQFNKNEHYIQKIMDNLPQSKNKNLRNNFNYDRRKHLIQGNNYSILNNKDNNVDYYNYNNKNIYNNHFYKDLTNDSINNNTIINNGETNYNINIKTMRTSKYLSMGKQKSSFNNKKNENKFYNHKNNINNFNKTNNYFNKYNKTFMNIHFNKINNTSNIHKLLKSCLISIKNKKYSDFIFNELNANFIDLLISFLDTKTLFYLSSTNKIFFKNIRFFLYNYFYNKLIKEKNKETKKKYIYKVLDSTKKFCSETIKQKLKNKEIKSFYSKLLTKNEIYDELIQKDMPRTLPNDINFKKGKINYNKLYNILTSFSNYNKKIGYAQGLNFICAQSIYLLNSEEEVFVFIDGFVNILRMDHFIGIGNERKMVNKLNEFSKILYKYVPYIVKYLEDKSVGHDFFSTSWILTLFSTSMDRNYLVIIWCFMIIFRWKFTFAFIIQILKRYERNILNSTEGQLCYKMKNILKQKDFEKDFDDIIQDTLIFMANNLLL